MIGGMTWDQFREVLNKIRNEHYNRGKYIEHIVPRIDMIDRKVSAIRFYSPIIEDKQKEFIAHEFNIEDESDDYDLYTEIMSWLEAKH